LNLLQNLAKQGNNLEISDARKAALLLAPFFLLPLNAARIVAERLPHLQAIKPSTNPNPIQCGTFSRMTTIAPTVAMMSVTLNKMR
jgi:hypothetical protein